MNESIKKRNRMEIDMTNGNLFLKIWQFCIPLALMGILNLLYNTADLIVVSNFSGDAEALGAVGSTGPLINLVINLFMGLSVGSNVVAARMYGSNNKEGLNRVVHTALLISFLFGIGLGIFGFIFAKQLLLMMNNDLELSRLYLRIYFIGLPFNLLYNFAASILRAVGDTKRPLIFLTISGLINVCLNLLFVIVFDMSVSGVALATIISQAISCVLIMITLYRTNESYQFRFKKLKLYKEELIEIVKIGLPAGIQSSLFSISNALIQSSVNKFGSIVMNGNSAAQSVEGFVWVSMNSVYHAALAFTGQNVGAKKSKNIKKVTVYCLIIICIIAFSLGIPLFIFGRNVLSIYTKVPAEIEVGYIRLHYLCLPYALCGIMDVMTGVLRGLGYSTMPAVVSIVGVCAFRVGWILLVFNHFATFTDSTELNLLYISYPLSWILTFLTHLCCYLVVSRKKYKILDEEFKLLNA